MSQFSLVTSQLTCIIKIVCLGHKNTHELTHGFLMGIKIDIFSLRKDIKRSICVYVTIWCAMKA